MLRFYPADFPIAVPTTGALTRSACGDQACVAA